MPLDSPAPRLHINTHTWNWKVSSHLPEAEERRKEWSWQWCRKVRELKVNFPRNRKYPSNTGTHTHTRIHRHTPSDRGQQPVSVHNTKKKKKKAISREMLLFNSHKNGEQYELCKKRNTEATIYGNFTCVETCAPHLQNIMEFLQQFWVMGSISISQFYRKKPDFRTAGICPRSPSYHDLEPRWVHICLTSNLISMCPLPSRISLWQQKQVL